MLNIINELSVFFEDCYREFSVREYSRQIKVSPPTSSKILKKFANEGLLLMREERGFLLFRINRENNVVRDLSRMYWGNKLNDLVSYLDNIIYPGAVVLFGSLSKLEVRKESDIDIAIFGGLKKDINLLKFEKKIGREVQLFSFESLGKVNKELRNNIINGYVLGGYLS